MCGATPETAFVGLRMHDICAGGDENAVLCRVTDETENPFSVTVRLLPEGAVEPIYWELDKALWQTLRAETIRVSLPESALMPLR